MTIPIVTMEEFENRHSTINAAEEIKVAQSVINEDYMQLLKWQDHPENFMRDVLNFISWTCEDADDQLDICHAIRDFDRVTVRSGNGPGKTAVAARIVIWYLFCFTPSIVITTAPTGRQVEKLLWGEIRATYKKANLDLGGELFRTEIRIDDEWYAIGFSTDEPDKFQGFHSPHILIVVDEACGVAEPIFEAIEGILTGQNAKLLLIGNPTNSNTYFGRTHLHPRESRGWRKLAINCWNTPNVRAKSNVNPRLIDCNWPANRLAKWGEYSPFYQVRVLGQFPESGEDSLVPYHMVHSALESSIQPVGKKVYGVDVAYFGGDKSVIGRLHGGQFRILRKIYKQDGEHVADKILQCLKEEPEDSPVEEIKVDIIGWGADCWGSLRRKKKDGTDEEKELLKKVKLRGVNFSNRCMTYEARKDYFNIRAEAGFMVRHMFEEGQIDIDDEDLGVQCSGLKYEFRSGRYILEEKDKFKKRFKESPDELDSLLIAKCLITSGIPTIW